MSKAFTKGQEVTLIGSWDNAGTVFYRNAVVHSCGKVQMVLTDAVTGEELGRHFRPELGDLNTISSFNGTATFPRLPEEQAVAACLQLGARIVQQHRERIAKITANRPEDAAFWAKEEAKLHAPEALNRTGTRA